MIIPSERPKASGQTRLVFERLRCDIVGARLLPGVKLNIAALAEEIGVSTGAVREGLAMLEAEALVVSEPARGYRVSPVSAVELRDLVKARVEVEKLCVAEAIRHGDLNWEGGIVSAFHQLTRVSERDASMPNRLSQEWATVHAGFHHALVSGCGNRWLMRLHEMLYQQSERYRQLSAPFVIEDRDTGGEHKRLVDAMLDRDIQGAQQQIADHLNTTAELLLRSPKFALYKE